MLECTVVTTTKSSTFIDLKQQKYFTTTIPNPIYVKLTENLKTTARHLITTQKLENPCCFYPLVLPCEDKALSAIVVAEEEEI